MADQDLIQLHRDEPIHPGGPVTADVPPSEVESWQLAGWRIVPATKHKEESSAKAHAEAVPEAKAKAKKRVTDAD